MGKGTALGVARDRFVEGLSEEAQQLRGALALVTASPRADRARDQLRRQLHSLHASAQAFRLTMLSDALAERMMMLDAAKEEGRAVGNDELDSLTHLIAVMPTLGTRTDSQVGPLPTGPAPSLPPPERRRRNTARGFPALSVSPPEAPSAVADGDIVVCVLVVDGAVGVDLVKRAVASAQYEVLHATNTADALLLARRRGPDLVLMARERATTTDLVTRLRSDRMTADMPIAILYDRGDAIPEAKLRELGVDAQVERDPVQIAGRISQMGKVMRSPRSMERIGQATLEQLAERLADEVQRGIVDATSGKDHSFDVGDGSEFLAAAWAAVEEVRTKLESRTAGRVRYREAAGPSFIHMESSPGTVAAPLDDVDDADESLAGRRIVVADDDPSIVWFFASLLQEAGATVYEAADGKEALTLARSHRPHVIIADIVMPELDGPALCRSIGDDCRLAQVPVILLSWKEDFINRLKELRSGASGYLRKEAESGVILERVHEVLQPLVRMEESLNGEGTAGGRVEGVGVYAVLKAMMERRPDAKLTVRDAHNLYEAEVRGGQLVDVTRTAEDGGFRRGQQALQQLLGVDEGRFTIDSTTTRRSRVSVREGEGDAIEMSARRLRAVTGVVRAHNVHDVKTVLFDDDFLAPWLTALPEHKAHLISRIRSGVPPRDALSGTPGELGESLVELARRGAVVEVRGAGGVDLVAAALGSMESEGGAPPESTALDDARATDAIAELIDRASVDASVDAQTEEAAHEDAAEHVSEDGALHASGGGSGHGNEEGSEPSEDDTTDRADDFGADGEGSATRGDEDASGQAGDVPVADVAEAAATRRSTPDAVESEEEALATPIPLARRLRTQVPDSSTPEVAPKHDDSEWSAGKYLVVLSLLFIAGYVVVQAMRSARTPPPPNDDAAQVESSPTESRVRPSEPVRAEPRPASEAAAAEAATLENDSNLAFGEIEVVPSDAVLAEGEGLLVVRGSEEVNVRLGGAIGRALGSPPQRVALPAGEYELIAEGAEGTRVRYVFVPAGQSRVVTF